MNLVALKEIQTRINHRFVKGGMLFAARSSHSFFSLLFALLAGRLLTLEDHGIFSQALARMLVIQAITEIGLQYSLVRFLSPALKNQNDSEAAAIVRASLQLKFYAITLVGLVVAVALLGRLYVPGMNMTLLPGASDREIWSLYWMLFLGGTGMSLFSYLDAVLVSHQSFFRLSLWIPSVGIIRLGIIAFYYFNGVALGIEHVLFAYLAGPFLSTLIYFLVFPADFFLKKSPATEWKPWVRKLILYNQWILLASFFSILSDWMEVLLIGDAGQTALFNAARMPMQGFLILLATMQSILLPQFSGLSSVEQYRQIFWRFYKILIPASVFFLPGIWIFSWFIPAWYGDEYNASVLVFYILYPNFILRIYFAPLGTALFTLDQPGFVMFEAFVRMVFGIGLNLLLIPLYGIIGAGIASFIAQGAGWLLLSVAYRSFFRTGQFPPWIPFIKPVHDLK